MIDRRTARGVLALALLAVCAGAAAQTSPPPAQEASPETPAVAHHRHRIRASEIGRSTTAWLALQRGNTEAAPAQPMLGAEAGLAWQRYMNSFRHPIPDQYDSPVNAGAGGSPGSGLSGAAQN
ncbi:DUF3613 domain-containing protein [Burkholderia sp. WAC0059]|uniref:DUF3613 domain-containing protein n=1 Tax=Burkholderia sp. WAC0059 TaxID=2066022 RepID=UPI000C7EF673|nr:DUF3613 domain-containing protein [Burkholderia sp. WAC0059]PLZ03365.1 DUF3613 domain-containing protein [Burkholderia sp. WAC0059]